MNDYPITKAILLQWYKDYNARFFGGGLPAATEKNFSIRNVSTRLGAFRARRSGGRTQWKITESSYYAVDEKGRRATLLHEMCHLSCFVSGHEKAHHGPAWQAEAARVSRLSGYTIARVSEIRYPVSEIGLTKQAKKKATKEKAYPIIVFPYDDGCVFVVKTSMAVLRKNLKGFGEKVTLTTIRTPEMFFLSDAFPKWPVRRGLRWGYRFTRSDFNAKILPLLKEGREYDSLLDLLIG